MRALGSVNDFAVIINPVADLAAGNNTGKRVHLRNYGTIDFYFFKNPASAGTDTVTLTLREHNANTGGTSQNLAAITDWYYKSTAALLTGAEAWTEVTQAAAATLALPDSGPVKATNQAVVSFSLDRASLSAGFEWVSIDIADPGAGGTILGGVFGVMSDLNIQRNPALLAQPNA